MIRRLLTAAALAFALTAQSPWSYWTPNVGAHGGHGQLTSMQLTSAVGLASGITGGVPAGTAAVVACNTGTASATYRYDGTAPTASVGTVLGVGSCLPISNPTLINAIQFIETASGAQIDIDFFKCTLGALC